jgi:hypothetical protein
MGCVQHNLQQAVNCDQHILDWQRLALAKVNEPARQKPEILSQSDSQAKP